MFTLEYFKDESKNLTAELFHAKQQMIQAQNMVQQLQGALTQVNGIIAKGIQMESAKAIKESEEKLKAAAAPAIAAVPDLPKETKDDAPPPDSK